MAAIGSKRQRFVDDGNDSMRVTSLVRSLVELPYVSADGTRVHPSPGSVASSRVAVQTDLAASTCVAFVASGGGVWRHAVPFAGGEDVAEGKEAVLKPTTVFDGRTTRVTAVRHRSEIQSLALHDPRTRDPRATSEDVRLASVDSLGRCLVTLLHRENDADAEKDAFGANPRRQFVLTPPKASSDAIPVAGWSGACFDSFGDARVVAVASHHAKTVNVYDGEALVRTLRTPLRPSAARFVVGGGGGGGGGGSTGRTAGVETDPAFVRDDGTDVPSNAIAVVEGNQVSLWDVRQGERGGCVGRLTLCPRGQPLLALASGASRGEDRGGSGIALPGKRRAGDPFVAAAGAERGIHVLDVNNWSVLKRWPSAMKFDVTQLEISQASPDHLYAASLDYELVCGCWPRARLAGGFAFRGDSRWFGISTASGGSGEGPAKHERDIVAGWCESGHLFAARVERVPFSADAEADADADADAAPPPAKHPKTESRGA
jgi:hypothetical protein